MSCPTSSPGLSGWRDLCMQSRRWKSSSCLKEFSNTMELYWVAILDTPKSINYSCILKDSCNCDIHKFLASFSSWRHHFWNHLAEMSQLAMNLQVRSKWLSWNSKPMCYSFFFFFFLVPKIPTHLTLLRDRITSLTSMSLKSHLRDWKTGC